MTLKIVQLWFDTAKRAVGVMSLVCVTAWLVSGCAPLCEEDPPGREVGLATGDEPFNCLPSRPNNNDATCGAFAAGLKDEAAARAAATCVRIHNLQCQRRECRVDCVPAARVTAASLFLTKNFVGCPNPANEDACRLLGVAADCECACPDEGT